MYVHTFTKCMIIQVYACRIFSAYDVLRSTVQSELIGQWVHHTISLMYVGARHLEFGITSHIVT